MGGSPAVDSRLLPNQMQIRTNVETVYDGPVVSQYPRPESEEAFYVAYSYTGTNIREVFDNDETRIYEELGDIARDFVNATEDEIIVQEGEAFDDISLSLSVTAGTENIAYPGSDYFQPLTLRFT